MRSMEGVIMAVTVPSVTTKTPPPNVSPIVVQRLLPAPIRQVPFDAAHEHWPMDNFHAKHQDQTGKERCPPDVYIG